MKILISGAGIAGLTLGYWLKKYGFKPTIIEVAPKLRNEGYMMDFFGPGVDVAKAMDIYEKMEKKSYRFKNFVFTNPAGKKLARINLQLIRNILNKKYLSIMRGDLEDILYHTIKDAVPVHFDTSIKTIEQSTNNVEVTFQNRKKQTFDLVIGADGIHSQVRNLVFGPEKNFSHHLGCYVASFIIPNPTTIHNDAYICADVQRTIGAYTIRGNKLAPFFIFTLQDGQRFDHKHGKQLLKKAFKHSGPLATTLIKAIDKTNFIFLDEVQQIKMPHWSKGRISLVGDANACLTLLAGQGSTMAMAEAYVLATELQKAAGDYSKAFTQYEQILKPIVEQKQKEAAQFAKSFVPKTTWNLFITQLAVRFMNHEFILKMIFKGFTSGNIFQNEYPIKE